MHVAPQRERGPHPLPLFLATISRVCGDDRARLARVLAGLRRYQQAPAAMPRPLAPVRASVGHVSLRDHGGTGPLLVVIPSLINPPTVLDLASGQSLIAGLVARGFRLLSVDWGAPEGLNLADTIADRLVPLLRGIGAPIGLIGYCLGGTLALGAATLLGPQVARIALLATPWHFGGYGAARAQLAGWWQQAGPLAASLGSLPMDLLQPAFWALDEAGVTAKYEALAAMPGAGLAAFVRLEDWSNGGQPLALAAARDLAEALFAADVTGRGAWMVGGQRVDPAALACPILDVIARRDHIVPAAASLSSAGIGTALPLDAGHVGMIIGHRAPDMLWQPLADWFRPMAFAGQAD